MKGLEEQKGSFHELASDIESIVGQIVLKRHGMETRAVLMDRDTDGGECNHKIL